MNLEIKEEFERLNEEIKSLSEKKEELFDLNDIIRLYENVNNQLISLKATLAKIKPKYYEQKMRDCEHIFAECFMIDHQYENESHYDIVGSYYCLKCGCLSLGMGNIHCYDQFEWLSPYEPSSMVPGYTQLDIINNSLDSEIVSMGISNIRVLMSTWKNIESDYPDLSFEEKVKLLTDYIGFIPSFEDKNFVRFVSYPKLKKSRAFNYSRRNRKVISSFLIKNAYFIK